MLVQDWLGTDSFAVIDGVICEYAVISGLKLQFLLTDFSCLGEQWLHPLMTYSQQCHLIMTKT